MPPKKPVIGYIGNFIPPFSTENDRKWSFEKLGYTVLPLQENKITAEELRRLASGNKFHILFYTDTHDWNIPHLVDVFLELRKVGIPTVSVHLDRWAWLDRQKDIGVEATWFTEYQFMADGSPEAVKLYEKHRLNWYYLPAGVVERDCYMAAPDPARFPYEIVFVGSKGYHKEYPFRPKLIEFLQKTYGERFGHYGNDGIELVRGDDLNVLMASAKIVVGDSCFGGRPEYVSDRYYETRGRGGFLIHPVFPGIESHGVYPYVGKTDEEKLEDLKYSINYYLVNEDERERLRDEGFEWVKEHETYTNRAQQMLDIIYGRNEKSKNK